MTRKIHTDLSAEQKNELLARFLNADQTELLREHLTLAVQNLHVFHVALIVTILVEKATLPPCVMRGALLGYQRRVYSDVQEILSLAARKELTLEAVDEHFAKEKIHGIFEKYIKELLPTCEAYEAQHVAQKKAAQVPPLTSSASFYSLAKQGSPRAASSTYPCR